jgi:hypothetical protein
MLTGCQCTEAGWCERHQVQKSEHLVALCQGNESYFDAWEKGRGPGQLKRDPNAKARVIQRPRPSHGPGTELKKLLKLFGIFSKGGCDCAKHAMVMDQMGPGRCLEKIDTIIGWLEKEAKARHLPFVRAAAMVLVKRAISNAKRAEEQLQD